MTKQPTIKLTDERDLKLAREFKRAWDEITKDASDLYEKQQAEIAAANFRANQRLKSLYIKIMEGRVEDPAKAFDTGEWLIHCSFADFDDFYIVHNLRTTDEETKPEPENKVVLQ